MLEHTVAFRVVSTKPGDQVLLQEANVDIGIDFEAGQDEDGQAHLAVRADYSDHHDARRMLSFMRGS